MTTLTHDRVEEFLNHHGGRKALLRIGDSAWLSLPDGAMIDDHTTTVEPPADPYERAKRVVLYFKEKLARADKAHAHAHQQARYALDHATRDGTSPSRGYLDTAAETFAHRAVCREELKAAEQKLLDAKPQEMIEEEKRREESAAFSARVRNEYSDALSKLR